MMVKNLEKATEVVSRFINLDSEVKTVPLHELAMWDTGSYYSYDSSAGCKIDKVKRYIVKTDGEMIDLPYSYQCHEYGSNHIADSKEENGYKIGDFIDDDDDIFAVIEEIYYNCEWEDYGYENKTNVYFVDKSNEKAIKTKLKSEIIEKLSNNDVKISTLAVILEKLQWANAYEK